MSPRTRSIPKFIRTRNPCEFRSETNLTLTSVGEVQLSTRLRQTNPPYYVTIRVSSLLQPMFYLKQGLVSKWHNNLKAGHSHVFQNGICGTREGKSNRQGRKPMKIGTKDSKRWNSNELKIQAFLRRFQLDPPMRGQRHIKGSD
ncbi:hypothetical protein AVEN_213265-1 [Araneus ventricosus]|uniref:Uncharacterized protein n=1 Tax=Araneus ventricosus TaxID=182803 RepID=A0A4Y2DE22_ARAVE|nr:hypothetical protein AVEN_213265-1 [Araneus ventricosus]